LLDGRRHHHRVGELAKDRIAVLVVLELEELTVPRNTNEDVGTAATFLVILFGATDLE
jgi:hypothetical protein